MKTQVATLVLTSLALLSAAEEYPHTKEFGSSSFHHTPEFDNVAKGGIAAGYFVFGIFLIFAWVRIWVDEGQRHSQHNKDLRDDISEMRRLGCDIPRIDAEYEALFKKKKKVAEVNDDFIAQAAAQNQ